MRYRLAFEPYSCSTCTVRVLPTERTVFQKMLSVAGGDTKPEIAKTIRVCTYDVLQALRAAHPGVQVRLLHRIIILYHAIWISISVRYATT
jgi:hypothetical protein